MGQVAQHASLALLRGYKNTTRGRSNKPSTLLNILGICAYQANEERSPFSHAYPVRLSCLGLCHFARSPCSSLKYKCSCLRRVPLPRTNQHTWQMDPTTHVYGSVMSVFVFAEQSGHRIRTPWYLATKLLSEAEGAGQGPSLPPCAKLFSGRKS